MKSVVPTILAGLTIAASTTLTAAPADVEWSYNGDTGPQKWGSLTEAFEACEKGLMQSPIELAQAGAVGDLEFSVDYRVGPLDVPAPGKAVQANFTGGSYMTSGGKVFELVQAHFHTPSEHTVDGDAYPLVIHFVHATGDGELGVLGVLFEPGEANDELQKIIDAAEGDEADGVTLDPNGLVPDELEIYRYMGSLTTPPCSEGVHWHVAEDALTASPEQIAAMEKMMGNNARPVQPLNGRLLVEPD